MKRILKERKKIRIGRERRKRRGEREMRGEKVSTGRERGERK